jgi:hypothetical protein
MAGASWWAGVLATLASQSGNAYLRFVGRVDGQRRYKGATFPAPRTLDPLPPQEAWAPGMTKSLQDLRREIENDGWVEQAGVPGPGRSGTNIPNRLLALAARRPARLEAPTGRADRKRNHRLRPAV